MKKYTLLFALLLVAIFGSERVMAIELDTVWVSDINGQVLFQHPVTKNILVAANGGITELNSQDGKFVRSFPFDVANSDLSPDGTKILNSEMNTKIYNFSEELPFYTIENSMHSKFLGNNYIVYKTLKSNGNKIAKINLETKETVITPVNGGITAIATSPDGKYIAYTTYEENNGSDSKVYLYLLDTETMKEITELGNWDSEYQRIESISFSPNSQYLTYNLDYSSKTQINIYDVHTKSIYKSLNWSNFFYNSAGFEFLGNDLYIQKGTSSDLNKYEFGIYKFGSNELIYKVNQLNDFLYYSKLNLNNNHLTYNDRLFNIVCVNFNNIISSIPQFFSIKVRYNNKMLIIQTNEKTINHISLMTIEGREVYSQELEKMNINNTIEIPLELSNGLYIINITSGKESFTQKLIVME